MKHTIRFIILFFALVMAGTGNVRAISESDIIFNVLPNSAAGTISNVTVSGMTVTFNANPASGYSIDASHIIAEKMVDAMAPRRAPGMASSLTVSGTNPFSFTIPGGYTGAYVTVNFYQDAPEGFTQITSLSEIPNTPGGLAGKYQLTADVSGVSTSLGEFKGTLDGGLHKIIGSSAPLFTSTDGAIIRNIIFEDVNISSGDNDGDAGAVTSKAKGATRIYNCGINPTSVERDNAGNITGFSGSTVSGSGNVGGLVGTLSGNARVINCYSYATITGGSNVGGIVGNNTGTTTAGSINTMVMNCMFYGDITGGSTVSPVYGGNNINNLKAETRPQDGLNTYNYYSYENLKTKQISNNKYNCALAVEEKYLNRFEFYRLLLNSNKKLAAIYAIGSADNANQMAKWVLETADRTIVNPLPYPVLKPQGYYPSIINIDAENAPDSTSVGRNMGGKLGKSLTVNINLGSGYPEGAEIKTGKSQISLVRTDKDEARFNFNYDKVQLPYYNDVGEGNYTGNRVVTGWKITAIDVVTGDPYTSSNYPTSGVKDYPDHNYADRKSSNKDLYSVSGRVFSQGAYFDVPYGVTSITIEPYWAKAAYVSDVNYDVVYKNDYTGKQNVSQTGTQVGSGATFNGDANQVIKTSVSAALGTIESPGSTVYDNAVVLVGNLHLDGVPSNGDTPFTLMSVDKDNDHEPDYSLVYHHKNRLLMSPIRFDFLDVIGTAQAQKPNTATLICNMTICRTKGWFEITNTSLMYFSQFEYENLGKNTSGSAEDNKDKVDAPLILQGGVIDQFVSTQNYNVTGKVIYIHVGGNVWIHEFSMGTHSDGSAATPHVPVSVTGGDFPGFYLTGTYNANATVKDDNAECYISGGRFGELAGAGQEQIGTSESATTKGNIRWQIYNADITDFFGGGVNEAKPVQGNITTDIYNSHVTLFCGGPKFGNMASGKNVKTTAEGCVFGKYFGAGYGGNSYSRKKYYDQSGNPNWNTLGGYYTTDRGKYFDGATTNSKNGGGNDKQYGKKGPGVATDFDYEFFVWSSGTTGARLFVKFVSFSLAQCNDVESTLKSCKILENFYGGGSLGKVSGTATSSLEDCEVTGNVFGAGYSATLPKIEVRKSGFTKAPNFNSSSGMFEPGTYSGTDEFTWKQVESYPSEGGAGFDGTQVKTTQDISSMNLGSVGEAILTIKGSTTVAGSVYGGGEESGVDGNTVVNVTSGTIGVANAPAYGALVGNVYGGGRGKADDKLAGLVKGNTQVTISGTAESPFIYHNVYGGGAYGSVGDFIYDNTTGMPTALKTENTGECNVTITGGKIGTNGQNNGMVFGSSRGDVAIPVNGVDPNDILAWVYKTNVVIGDEMKGTLNSGNGDDYTKPLIKGSIYGSGENGHTFNDAEVKVHSGTIGIAEGEEVEYNGIHYLGPRYLFRGNVYGGGCGTDTYDTKDDQDKTKTYYNFNAGIVKGNTSVTIDGGHVIHNVYGSGSMGSVGTFTFDENKNPTECAENTGKCKIEIRGGIIGTIGMRMKAGGGPDDYGHVFGAGRGETKDPDNYPNIEICSYCNETDVTITDKAFVMGSVYGGSESGHVLTDTKVTVAGGQIGCGEGKTEAYTEDEWANELTSVFKPTNHWDYVDDGAPYDQYADEQGNYANGVYARGGLKQATDGHTFYGNVFGGGSGYYPYAQGKWLFTAGRVGRNARVFVTGGHILNNVYGGCEMSDVMGDASITMSGGTVGVPRSKQDILYNPAIGHVFGAGMGDKRTFFNQVTNVENTIVTVTGGKVYGSVHGGGEDGHVLSLATTNIRGGEIGTIKDGTTSGFDGNVFGGGQGSPTALTAGTVGGNVVLNIEGGTMHGSVYGGGRIASVGTFFELVNSPKYGKMQDGTDHGYITVNLTGGTIDQNVYGGCMGTRGQAAVDQVRFAVSKNITVELNREVENTAKGCVVKGSIFGCNNVNSSPQGQVEVHIYKTQNADASRIAGPVSEGVQPKVKGRYDVKAVYGGGNMAAYLPKGPNATDTDYDGKNTTLSTKVIIEGCGETSIQQVYGGGNAASTPATEVTVNGCYEIDELFGGGNGKDKITINNEVKDNPGANVGFYDYSDVEPTYNTKEKRQTTDFENNYVYGTGKASVNIFGGTIHRVFGGSNTKGNVRKTAVTMLEESSGCDFCVDEAYGGGKSAEMDAEAKLLMACIPGLKEVYGGAEDADVHGNVTLNITNGTFDRVFGGNNLSGTISGSITINIEEVGCRPIIIGELYGGGNQAAYSVLGYNGNGTIIETGTDTLYTDPQVNVKSFTSIGSVYGGGYGSSATMVGNPTVNINVAMGDKASVSAAVIGQDGDNWKDMAVKDGKVVEKSTEGSYPIPYHKSGQIGAIGQVFGGGNAAPVKGDTEVNIGTKAKVPIRNYVAKDVTVGTTSVEGLYTRSGEGTEASPYKYTAATGIAVANTTYYEEKNVDTDVKGADIRGNVYGGGNQAEVTGNTNVNIGKENTTTSTTTTP